MTDEVRWVKWDFAKWRGDAGLRMCGLAARGLWADLLAVMHECEPYGHLAFNGRAPTPKQIASIVGMTSEEEIIGLLRELEDNGVFSRTDKGLIFSRKQVRDKTAREVGKRNGAIGGNPVLTKRDNPRTNPPLYDREEKRREELESEKNPPTPQSVKTRASPVGDEIDFEQFWKEYPRKDDKGHARKAWAAARRKAASEAILAGLRRHQFAEDPKFRPLAATWLNGERWADATASPAPQRLPDVPPSFNPPDAWGVRAWVLRQPDVTMQRGSMPYDEYAINGEIVEDVAIGVLDAAGISPSARPNLDVLGAWIRDDCCPLAVLDQIRRQVAHMDGPARSLAAFDTVVRSYVDPIAREIAEMDAALARVGVSR